MHISRHPDVLLWFVKKFTGQITGHHRAYRANWIWPPMFYYDSWKVPFLTNHSISSVQHEKWAKFTGQTQRKFLQTQNCFFEILQNWNEMNVFLSFLKMWPFFTHWHPMFHYAQLHKKSHFCQFVWGDTEVHFQISLNVLYETILNLHSFIETKVNLLEKKDKRPNLYNKKILVFRHSDSLRFSLVCDTHYFTIHNNERKVILT